MNELMSPKEKAIEIATLFYNIDDLHYDEAIKCAIVSIKLILNETGCGNCKDIDSHYWNKVLHELELMKETN